MYDPDNGYKLLALPNYYYMLLSIDSVHYYVSLYGVMLFLLTHRDKVMLEAYYVKAFTPSVIE